MRIFVLLLVIGVVVVILGFYMNWFSVSSRNNEDTSTFIMTVDKDRIGDDKDEAVDRVQDFGRKVGDAASPDAEAPAPVEQELPDEEDNIIEKETPGDLSH